MSDEETQTKEALTEEHTPEPEVEVNKIPVFQQLSLLAIILLLIFGSGLTPSRLKNVFSQAQQPTAQILTTDEDATNSTQSEYTIPAFEDITIVAKAAYVWDINNQRVLYKKNETQQLPLASVTKLMTALVAQELLDENDTISINETAVKQDGYSGLSEGEVFNRLTLSDLVLMSSSNDGAFALASAAGAELSSNNPASAFVSAMNIRAEEIGLIETYFRNPTGLDISPTEGGAYGSARDMAFLMEYIVTHYPDILTYTRENEAKLYSQAGEQHNAENTNYYIDSIPGLIGSKTGYTDLAGGNLGVAGDAGFNRPIIIAVLGSSQQNRFTDVLALVKEAQYYVANE